MNFGLFGYGKMGKMVESVAISRNHIIVEKKEIDMPFEGLADIYIDFTLPEALEENVRHCCNAKKPMVIGTTGWTQKKEWVHSQALEVGIPIIYGGNFSLGVNLFWKALAKTTEEFSAFSDVYDVFTHEYHHRQKKDAPSGTAITTAQVIVDHFPAKKKILFDLLERRAPEAEELHVSSSRGGSIPGTHSVFFDSPFDTIEIVHTARTREGFAYGAVLAAEKVQTLPAGLHHFPDIFDLLF